MRVGLTRGIAATERIHHIARGGQGRLFVAVASIALALAGCSERPRSTEKAADDTIEGVSDRDGAGSRSPPVDALLLDHARRLAIALVAEDLTASESTIQTVTAGAVDLAPAFIELLGSPDHCTGAARALSIAAESTSLPKDALEDRLRVATGRCRIEVARLLWDTDWRASTAAGVIVDALGASDASERAAAAVALRFYDYEQKPAVALETARPALVAALASEDATVREASALALSHLDGEAADIPSLVEAVRRLEPGTSDAAAIALGGIGSEAEQAVADLVRSESAPLRRLGRVALRTMGPDAGRFAIPILLSQIAESPGPGETRELVTAASFLGVDACLKVLEVLPADRKRERVTTVNAVGSYGRKAAPAVVELVALLRDDDPDLRYAAAYSLKAVGAPGAAPAADALERLVRHDPVKSVRVAARLALEAIDAERLSELPTLEEIFSE